MALSLTLSRGQLALLAVGSSTAVVVIVAICKKVFQAGPGKADDAASKGALVDYREVVLALKDIASALKEHNSITREQLQVLKDQQKRAVEAVAAPAPPQMFRPPRPSGAGAAARASDTSRFQYDAESDTDDIFEDLPTSSLDVVAPPSVDSPSLFAEVDNQRARDDPLGALQLLESRESSIPANEKANYLWRRARGLFDKSERDKPNRQALLAEARTVAEQALALEPQNPDAHKWLAVSAGAYSDFETLKGKLDCGSRFRHHILEAIRLRSNDPGAHYLLGRWCLEVAGLTWLQKKACAAIVGTPPESTYDEALDCFTKAENLRPGAWKSNQLMIAKTLVKMSKKADAKSWLSRALAIPTVTLEDRTAEEEARALLASL